MDGQKLTPNSITITYIAKVSFGSLNGSDKEVDNINPIKKIKLSDGRELPYMSSQAIRRALRDRLEEMGYELSVIKPGGKEKAPGITACDPEKYIDDDLFGYMDADGRSQRTSPVRVEALVSLTPYQGDLDYGTNFMAVGKGGEPNIFETEIHSGFYRGTILIELDRIGKGRTVNNKFEEKDFIDNKIKLQRTLALIQAIQTLWTSGRQTRFLTDISPKFIAAAYMKVKNPIFLESVNLDENNKINIEKLNTVVEDYKDFIEDYIFAVQKAVFDIEDENIVSLSEGFEKIKAWVKSYFNSQS